MVSNSEARAACDERLTTGWCAAVPLWWHRGRDEYDLMTEAEADLMREVPTWEGRGW